MTNFDAIEVLVIEAYKEKTSIAGYKRIRRALIALNFTHEERQKMLYRLDYCDHGGNLYRWLQLKLDEKKAA